MNATSSTCAAPTCALPHLAPAPSRTWQIPPACNACSTGCNGWSTSATVHRRTKCAERRVVSSCRRRFRPPTCQQTLRPWIPLRSRPCRPATPRQQLRLSCPATSRSRLSRPSKTIMTHWRRHTRRQPMCLARTLRPSRVGAAAQSGTAAVTAMAAAVCASAARARSHRQLGSRRVRQDSRGVQDAATGACASARRAPGRRHLRCCRASAHRCPLQWVHPRHPPSSQLQIRRRLRRLCRSKRARARARSSRCAVPVDVTARILLGWQISGIAAAQLTAQDGGRRRQKKQECHVCSTKSQAYRMFATTGIEL